MKNQFLKHKARTIKMTSVAPEEGLQNITVTSQDLLAERMKTKTGVLCYNLGPNRQERRTELKKERYHKAHGKYDERPIVNNRSNAGTKVFEKQAYFHLRLTEMRYRHLHNLPA